MQRGPAFAAGIGRIGVVGQSLVTPGVCVSTQFYGLLGLVARDPGFQIHTAEVLTVAEAAIRLRVGRTSIYQLVRRGELVAVHVGADLRIPVDAISAYLTSHLVAARQRPPSHSSRQRHGC